MSGSVQGRNPLNFELRVFLQGLRQKQHAWGAAWGIQKRFSQRLCIETVLTQKSSQGYCLEDVAILSQRKSSSREQPSYQLDFQQLGMAYSVAPICHESEIIGSQLKFSFINISIDWGGFILSDFSRLSIRN